jgi:putative ATP-binding cassette transporter
MPTAPIAPYDESVAHELRLLARAVNRTPGRGRLYLLAGAIVLVIVATAAMQVRLNAWNQPFYDAIERRDLPEFLDQLAVFFVIAGILLVLNVAQTGFNQLIRVRLRELATKDLIGCWMTKKRAARISRAGEIGVNPDQRIQADAQMLTELTTDLGVGLMQSSVLLASFIGVLWILSQGVVIPVGGRDLAIPGYMVWAALLYAISGSLVSWRVGRPLVRLGADRYAREAEFRASVVQGSERAEGIALNNREADVLRGLEASLGVLVAVLRRIAFARARLTWVTAGYGWVGLIFPIVVAAPGYFSGRLSFGELMMVVGAFNQVQTSLRWFVENTSQIADWRATLLRVMNFRHALIELDAVEARAGRIERREDPEGGLRLDAVRVETRHGCTALAPPLLEVGPGERALILGRPGSGRTSFFLAIAGLWSAGSGRISVPAAEVSYLTQRPFLPADSLRAALCSDGAPHDDAELRGALGRVGLDHLGGALDTAARWDRDLGLGDQERLAYARLLLARPKWLICDEGLDPVDEANRQMLLSILAGELGQTAVVNISQRHEPAGFYGKVVELVASPSGAGRQPRPRADPAASGVERTQPGPL